MYARAFVFSSNKKEADSYAAPDPTCAMRCKEGEGWQPDATRNDRAVQPWSRTAVQPDRAVLPWSRNAAHTDPDLREPAVTPLRCSMDKPPVLRALRFAPCAHVWLWHTHMCIMNPFAAGRCGYQQDNDTKANNCAAPAITCYSTTRSAFFLVGRGKLVDV